MDDDVTNAAPTNEQLEQHILHVMAPEALDKTALVLDDGEQAQDHLRRRACIDRAHELIGFAVDTIRVCALHGPTDRRQEAYGYAVRVEDLSKRLKALILLHMAINRS
jgi:hypothetical protein